MNDDLSTLSQWFERLVKILEVLIMLSIVFVVSGAILRQVIPFLGELVLWTAIVCAICSVFIYGLPIIAIYSGIFYEFAKNVMERRKK